MRQRSRERRHQRKVAREQRRLALALAMVQEAQERLALLLPPEQLMQEQIRPQRFQVLPPEQFNPSPGLTLVEQMEPLLTQELARAEPTEDDRLLGLRPLPTSPPSSES